MAANTAPIYTKSPKASSVDITAANTVSTGTGTIGVDLFLAFTAGAEGSYVQNVVFQPVASVAGTNTAASVLRAYLSTQGAGVTVGGTDTFLLGELSAPVQSADNATTGTYPWELTIEKALPPGSHILVSSHAAPAANTTFQATVFGGDY